MIHISRNLRFSALWKAFASSNNSGTLQLFDGTLPPEAFWNKSNTDIGNGVDRLLNEMHLKILADGYELLADLNYIPEPIMDQSSKNLEVNFLGQDKPLSLKNFSKTPKWFYLAFAQNSALNTSHNIAIKLLIVGTVGPTGDMILPDGPLASDKEYLLSNFNINT